MPPSRPPRLLALSVAAAAVVPLLGGPPAAAETPAVGETVVGELMQGYADPFPSSADDHAGDHVEDHAADLISWIRTDSGETIRVPSADVEDIATGSTVEVTLGAALDDEVAAADLAPAQEVLAAEVLTGPEELTESATSAVNHEVTVVMLQPDGSVRDGTTLDQVVTMVDGPVADFWAEQTDGAVRLGVVGRHDWTTPSTVSCRDPLALWEQAAARAGWSRGPGRHLLVYVPSGSPGCAYGLGTIGSGISDGGLSYVQAVTLSVMAHEIGHNLGLGHASALRCDRTLDRGDCAVAQYFDHYDVMGVSWGPVGSLNAPHTARLGVMPGGSAPTMAAGAPPAQFVLSTAGSRTGVRAVQLVDADGDTYWVEFRTPVGRDGWLVTSENRLDLQRGVQIRLMVDGGDTSLLLDGSPSAKADWSGDLQVALPGAVPVTIGDERFAVSVLGAGSTSALVQVLSTRIGHPIDLAYERLGGATLLGKPTSPHVCGLRDGGCRREYAGGTIAWSYRTGAHVVRGAILDRWRSLGAEDGVLGYPVGGDARAANGGFETRFAGGTIYWSAATGARVVRGAILARYVDSGGPGALGYPVADDGGTADGTGALVRLQGGAIYWSRSTGAHVVRGAILDRWRSLGAQTGVLGYPVGGDARAANGGFETRFAGGTIYWSAATGARVVRGAILARYVDSGGPGALGYPVADDGGTADGTGALVRLQGGAIYWSRSTGAHVVRGAILDRWRSLGAQTGVLGYPVGGDARAANGGFETRFAGGTIYWSAATGARVVRGAILARYVDSGGPGALGYPVADDGGTADGTGALVRLQGGAIYWSRSTGAHVVRGAILDRWRSLGAQTGALGYPISDHAGLPDGSGYEVRFQGGTVVERNDGEITVQAD
ncbi:zinc-dependent metalloprotease family protein [Blastococcus sp. HT6-30]|uniref:zinc-dependent metalloprotease family protein n=1 Tax=Blastococcus sp. HT6-30 TaxID=3144843 RepID=UPI003219C762